MEPKNCETWGAAASCCVVHENVHIEQLKAADKWCKYVTHIEVVNGAEKHIECCLGADSIANYSHLTNESNPDWISVERGSECPAHEASLNCCLDGMKKPLLTDQEYLDLRQCAYISWSARKGYKCDGYENDPNLPPYKLPSW